MNKFLGIGLVVLGAGLAVVPFVSDCASHGEYMIGAMGMKMPMVCYGNRTAELATSIPMIGAGAALAFVRVKSRIPYYSLSALVIVLAGAGIMMPTTFIGTCKDPLSTCNTIMKPAIIGIGSLAAAGGLMGAVITNRMKTR